MSKPLPPLSEYERWRAGTFAPTCKPAPASIYRAIANAHRAGENFSEINRLLNLKNAGPMWKRLPEHLR